MLKMVKCTTRYDMCRRYVGIGISFDLTRFDLLSFGMGVEWSEMDMMIDHYLLSKREIKLLYA